MPGVLDRAVGGRPAGINPGCSSRTERIVGWMVLVCFVAVILWIGATILIWPSFASVGSMLVPVGVFAVGATAANRIASRLSRREVIAADYCLCLECRYPLGALPSTGACPECGTEYQHQQVRMCWRWTLDGHGGS